ncbi:DUF4112 domain-containing protein [Aporhodopirellula aestuarii]|uniref:DUF4112 domain-containing protein n=1 Tax=Aporhodopirellula aestuarii TaxID=2950107 RepID=A0ABT0U0M7_9BACT|nr:DUF4112 domain-containing protein [Aporhodopirellula aestuarii]MCM2370407.1 DUF4112 domain-containing protein [Aporhodopirellula aestuarii]
MKRNPPPSSISQPKPMRWVDNTTKLLDAKFRIPGTRIRFGLDFLLGLLPGAGDAVSLAMSGVLIATMAKHGASPMLVLRMLGNVVLDAVVGSVPVAGNVFDLFFRANSRNLKLMREHYEDGKHNAHAWPILLAIFAVMVVVLGGLFVFIAMVVHELLKWIGAIAS